MATKNTFELTNDSYAAFDALSLKRLIIDRLNTSDVFTDQNFEGSNINQVIDIIAYSYHVLLFYLNQTASESIYSQATLNENINKIVKLLNYKPIGYQTATLNFSVLAQANLTTGSYTIPRYSYFSINGIDYFFNEDKTFTKTVSSEEALTEFSNTSLLYQGTYVEYPTYTAIGEPYEQLTILAVDRDGNNELIDHFNIDVYVRDNTALNPRYTKYDSTDSLFLENFQSKKYEIRLNENGRYEIKFGNNTFGRQLKTGDDVAIYYLKTDGTRGEVTANVLNQELIAEYTSSRFQTIIQDTLATNLRLATTTETALLQFSNNTPSTQFQDLEGVDNIRENAVNTFKTQYRLATTDDIQTFIKRNFSNIISSNRVVNNRLFVEGHLKYYFDLGVERPSQESRLMFNQVKFSTGCNFNNLYLYAVPRIDRVTSLTTRVNYLNTAQKQFIIDKINPYKIATSEIVPVDPVYVQVGFGIKTFGLPLTPSVADNSYLEVTVDGALKRNFISIQTQIANFFINYFKITNDNLGKFIDLTELSSQIISIVGVKNFKTVRVDGSTSTSFAGISLLIFNPVYPEVDIEVHQQNIQLPYFKFPYLGDSLNFVEKIKLVSE